MGRITEKGKKREATKEGEGEKIKKNVNKYDKKVMWTGEKQAIDMQCRCWGQQ